MDIEHAKRARKVSATNVYSRLNEYGWLACCLVGEVIDSLPLDYS